MANTSYGIFPIWASWSMIVSWMLPTTTGSSSSRSYCNKINQLTSMPHPLPSPASIFTIFSFNWNYNQLFKYLCEGGRRRGSAQQMTDCSCFPRLEGGQIRRFSIWTLIKISAIHYEKSKRKARKCWQSLLHWFSQLASMFWCENDWNCCCCCFYC